MGWADWMVVKQTLEEELALERQVRDIESCHDIDSLQKICGAVVRQNWHYAQLVKQAVGRIAEMDAMIASGEAMSESENFSEPNQLVS